MALVVSVLAAVATTMAPPAQAAPIVAAGFTEELVHRNVLEPTDVAFTPDGRMLIATRPGQVRVAGASGTLLAPAALDLGSRTCLNGERGLLGLTVDPAFASNKFVYLFWSRKVGTTCGKQTVGRLSRFVLPGSNIISANTEKVLLDNIPEFGSFHNGGGLAFGRDGNLYVSVGDGGCDYAQDSGCAAANDAARDQNALVGKVLRITRDGGIPSGNPFTGTGTARCARTGVTTAKRCQETYSFGLRNPFRIASDPSATRIFVNDVGQRGFEEVNQAKPGADFGWNLTEGPCLRNVEGCGAQPPGITKPLFSYTHTGGCTSITGGAFVPPGAWPSVYDGSYVYADYVCGSIFSLRRDGTAWRSTPLVRNLGGASAVAMGFGPLPGGGKALYYTTFEGGGQIRRLRYSGSANRAPYAEFSSDKQAGTLPLLVQFDASESRDPDGHALTYLWDFGDGGSTTTGSPTVQHAFTTSATRTVTLRVRDAAGATSAPVTASITAGDAPPSASIGTPGGTMFSAGQSVQLVASASDPEDGGVPADQHEWSVLILHDTHYHPLVYGARGSSLTFTAPSPEDVDSAAHTSLLVTLAVRDSRGTMTEVRKVLDPRLIDVTVATQPAGAKVNVNGDVLTGPRTFKSWAGWPLRLNAHDQELDGVDRTLTSWSQGGAAAQTVTPTSSTSYTATFGVVPSGRGLTARYFDNADFTGPSTSRIDERVDFVWPAGPTATIGPESFSVRWTGTIDPRYAETYVFSTTSDDGIRVWVDGTLVIDNFTPHGAIEDRGKVTLTPGPKPIKVEYFNGPAGGSAILRWTSPSQPLEVVPVSRLRPT